MQINSFKAITVCRQGGHFDAAIYTLVVMLLACVSLTVFAAQPTSLQIQQFKSLPVLQQQALAKQYGFNSEQFRSMGGTQPNLDQALSQPLNAAGQNENDSIEANAQAAGDEINISKSAENKVISEKIALFGYNLFENSSTSFMPATDIPIPSEYVLGPGDSIFIQLYGKENASHALTVNREGLIQFPDIGPISVAGLNFIDLKKLIITTVEKHMIGVKASITMGELRSIRIFILGEVLRPGSYTVGSLSSMTNAIFSSGGVSKVGSLRNIQLKRAGKLIASLDLYDLLLHGDTSSDIRLLPGDVIFIPPIGQTVGISGEVRRPAIYELKHETKVEEIVEFSGGLLPTAYPQASRIERIEDNGKRILVDVDLSMPIGRSFKLRDADVIQVFSVLESIENVVLLKGHVGRPGGFAWKENLHFSDILSGIDEMLPNPDLNNGVIIRLVEPTRHLKVLLFNPLKALTNPRGEEDPLLSVNDEIIIFDYESNRAETLKSVVDQLHLQANKFLRRQLVVVGGHVRFPGMYPLTSNMNVARLIDLAGGLTDRAFGQKAEITRYQMNKFEQQFVEHKPVLLSQADRWFLQEEDELQIKSIPNWADRESVTLTGEVVFPGNYTLSRGETLSSLIGRAGGLNQYAYTKGAIFTREMLRELETDRIKDLRNNLETDIAAANIENQDSKSKIAIADAAKLLEELGKIKPMGRMVIDLQLILENPEDYDVTLQNGDKISIPRVQESVTVVGEVHFATSHIFDKKYSVFDYVSRSGGITPKADKSNIYVVKASGSVYHPTKSRWFNLRNESVEPGDTVVVPLDADRIKSLTLWSNVSEIFYQIALGAAAVSSF